MMEPTTIGLLGIGVLVLMLVIGIPIVFVMLLAPGLDLFLHGQTNFFNMLIQRWVGGIDSFPLMALPVIAVAFFSQLAGGEILRRFVALQTQLPLAARAATLALLSALILRMGPDGVFPFIYFQF